MTTLKVSSFRDIDEARDRFLSDVNAAADQQRAISPAQVEVYEAKYREALQGGGPHIEAEADVLGLPLAEVIESVLTARQKQEVRNAQIEAKRIKAKAEIRAADTPAKMYRISQSFKEFLNGFTEEAG